MKRSHADVADVILCVLGFEFWILIGIWVLVIWDFLVKKLDIFLHIRKITPIWHTRRPAAQHRTAETVLLSAEALSALVAKM